MRLAATRSSTSFGSGGPAVAGAACARAPRTRAAAARALALAINSRRRVTCSKVFLLSGPGAPIIGGALLSERAGEKAADEVALQPDNQHERRHARQHGGGRDVAPGYFEHPGKEGERNGHRAARFGSGKSVREEKLVPREEKGEERGGGEPGREERQHDPPKGTEAARAVHRGRLLELRGNLLKKSREEPDDEGEGEGRVGQDEGQPRVAQIEGPHQEIEGAHGRDLRKGGARYDEEEEQALAGDRIARDPVGAEESQHQGEHGGDGADAEAVAESAEHHALIEHGPVVLPGEPAGQERRQDHELRLGLERSEELPEERPRIDEKQSEDGRLAGTHGPD